MDNAQAVSRFATKLSADVTMMEIGLLVLLKDANNSVLFRFGTVDSYSFGDCD